MKMKAVDSCRSVVDWGRRETGPPYHRRPHASRRHRGGKLARGGGTTTTTTEKGLENAGMYSQ